MLEEYGSCRECFLIVPFSLLEVGFSFTNRTNTTNPHPSKRLVIRISISTRPLPFFHSSTSTTFSFNAIAAGLERPRSLEGLEKLRMLEHIGNKDTD